MDIPRPPKKFGADGFIDLVFEGDRGHCSCANMVHPDGKFFRRVERNCFDEKMRLDEMKRDGVQTQVLSTVPVLFAYDAKGEAAHYVSSHLNDHLGQLAQNHPREFKALGTLPMQDVELATRELQRSMKELKLSGVMIGTHVGNDNLGDEKFFEFYSEAEKLGATLFIHPWDMMGKETMSKYWLPWLVGMPAETSRAICSFIFGGIFKKFSKLKVVFAHGGGSFMGTFARIRHGHRVRPDLCAIDNTDDPINSLGKFYVDSLVHDPHVLSQMVKFFGEDFILAGSDYPFPLGELPLGGALREAQLERIIKEKIAYKNAEKLLR